jgi:hypothetical protein
LLCLSQPVFAQTQSWQDKIKDYWDNLDIYNRTINYIRQEREAEPAESLNSGLSVSLFVIDLFLSLFCLWLVIRFLTEMKTLLVKKYLWFLLVWNITWFMELLIFKGVWRGLSMVFSLRPDLGIITSDNSPVLLIVISALLYIWLLVRTFRLNFWGALTVFLSSHLVYFILIFFILNTSAVVGSERLYTTLQQGFSLRQLIRNYIKDTTNIAQGQSIFFLMRIKPYHL